MERKWWKEVVAYQIYPMSFKDTNNDGIGDLNGIIEKLPYLHELGVGLLWLTPIYCSPNADNGYDISDYRAIDPRYGDIKDLQKLIKEAHALGIRIILDMVINHTSDEHEWFIASKNGDDEKKDYYIWREGKNNREPNNWWSFFGGSTWEYSKKREQYYLHLFGKKQPDLNWQNKQLRREIYDMMLWWLKQGIDGFRMDVINRIVKPKGLPDSKKEPCAPGGYVFDQELTANQSGIHETLKELRKETVGESPAVLIGETNCVDATVGSDYVCASRKELDMVFHFQISHMDPFDLCKYKKVQKEWYKVLTNGGWNTQFFSNHDLPRQVSRLGNDEKYWKESAKMLAIILHTMPGTPFIYQGEEIGMTNVQWDTIENYNDVQTKGEYERLLTLGVSPADAIAKVRRVSRDHARTPMQWDDTANAGFTKGKPWLAVNENYRHINVKDQLKDKDSIWYTYKTLIAMRRQNPVMVYGNLEIYNEEIPDTLCYMRKYKDTIWLVQANFAEEKKPAMHAANKILLDNYVNIDKDWLQPYEARITEIKNGN